MMFDLNPIDVLKQRKLSTTPPHFKKAEVPESTIFDSSIDDWIRNKLKGRYYLLRQPGIDRTGRVRSATVVGFEDSKELTYFMLACPLLRRN